MKILTTWLRDLLPDLPADDSRLAEDLTLRGIAVEGIRDLGKGNGSLFEMDITTNRVDAMNHYGVAREAAAIYGLSLAAGSATLPLPRPASHPIAVKVEDQDGCGRFTARILREVVIQPTASSTGPLSRFAARMFTLLEQKQISNAVDASNFAWLAMGQPTHVFDLDKLEGGITIRRARKGETLRTLDGVSRTLFAEDLIVADSARPLALAGVMGGWETMITPHTRNALVEAAWFDPVAVRGTARRHGLHTDASHRFERGADIQSAPLASDIVSAMILESGGYIEGELQDVLVPGILSRTAHRAPISLSMGEVRRILGTTIDPEGISADEVERILAALGCVPLKDSGSSWRCALPSWRLDLEREIDLVEEVARVYGYNRFANTLPAFAGSVQTPSYAEPQAALRSILFASGYHEAISSTFSSAEDAELTAPQPGLTVALENPLSDEAGVLRPSLIPGMLNMIADNLHRDIAEVRLFEIGTVFSGSTEKVEERVAMSIGVAGNVVSRGAQSEQRRVDFYDIKGVVEQMLSRFQTRSTYYDSFSAKSGLTPTWLHPYRAARVVTDGMTVGWVGQLHPVVAAARKLKEQVYVAQIYLDRVFRFGLRRPLVGELSRFQPVKRDFSFLVPAKVRWAEIDAALASLHMPELTDWRLREILRDGEKDYSLLIGATFQAADRTLRDQELQALSNGVVDALASTGARLRSQ